MRATNEYVVRRNGGYYIAGTRIGLDVVAQEFQDRRSAEAISEAYPSLGSLAKVYGAIASFLIINGRFGHTWMNRIASTKD